MVRVKAVIASNPTTKKADVSLFADTKAEMSTVTVDNIGDFPPGYSLEFGSSVMTASGELAFLKSDGKWNWTT